MNRFISVLLVVGLGLAGALVTSGCSKSVNPKVASSALDLALDLRIDHGAVAEHFAELKESISLGKGELKFKELSGEDVESKSWCFMKYTIGESEWGIVPGTQRDCTDEDDEDDRKRAKKKAKRWLNGKTDAQDVHTEINYLLTDGSFERALEAVATSLPSGFDFGACVSDAISVQTNLRQRLADERCESLMDGEGIDVVALIGERGLERLGVDLENVDDEDVEKAMKKYLGKLSELTGDDAAAFVMLNTDGWSSACFERNYLDHGETARALVLRKAADLCGDVAKAAARD